MFNIGTGVAIPLDPPDSFLHLDRLEQQVDVPQIGQDDEPADDSLGNAQLVYAVHEMATDLSGANLLTGGIQRRQLTVHPEGQGGDPAGGNEDGTGNEYGVCGSFSEMCGVMVMHDEFEGKVNEGGGRGREGVEQECCLGLGFSVFAGAVCGGLVGGLCISHGRF